MDPRDSKEVYHNTTAGYLLRTKPREVNEGGYAAGYSSMDTPLLLDDEEMLSLLAGHWVHTGYAYVVL